MAIEIKTIACPQCGSTNIQMTSEEKGVCTHCGAQFVIRQSSDPKKDHSPTDKKPATNKESCLKAVISPEFSKDQFIRKAWIALAVENAPIEVFDENFGAVVETEHQVFVDSLSVDVTYQASVGHDREEPYMDYETYYDREPYIAYEKQWNNTTKQMEERQVTKYREVQKERPVTKYKTVTDWSAISGSDRVHSTSVVENTDGQHVDKDFKQLFISSFRGVKKSSLHPIGKDLADGMQITDFAREYALTDHRFNIDSSVSYDLPGDHYRDLSWKASSITDHITALYKAPEYEASICFNGKTYRKRAVPFGSMSIGGDIIENSASPESVKENLLSALEKKNRDRKDAVERNVIKATNSVSLLTIALLAASILVSFCIRSTALVTAFFAVAAAAFFYNTRKVKKETEAEMKRANKEIEKNRAKTKAEIEALTKDYKSRLREALNNKLKSLGYEPATAAEL